MKRILVYTLFVVLMILLNYSCKKEDPDKDTGYSPTLKTLPVSEITDTSAESGGEIIDDGKRAIISRGVVWCTSSDPTIENNLGITNEGEGTGTYISLISGLTYGNTYYVRAYATNCVGTAYGNQIDFTTLVPSMGIPCPDMPTVTDYNGNVYTTVQVGNQCWMRENLQASNYSNGTGILKITSPSQWVGLPSLGARCWYKNDSATYAATYGALYNWYAVNNPLGLCPKGWHVPTDQDWQTLEMFLGMSWPEADSTLWRGTDEGGKMKEIGLSHWYSPNTGATNSSGLTVLPGGIRHYDYGGFYGVGSNGFWWSSSAKTFTDAWCRAMSFYESRVARLDAPKTTGFSVRCIRD